MEWNHVVFTRNHHYKHDNDKWCIRNGDGQVDSCVLCMIEVLESSTELILRKNLVLSSVLSSLLQANRTGTNLVDLLRNDIVIASQFVCTFVGLVANENQQMAKMSTEGAVQLLQVLQMDDVTSNVLRKIVRLVSQSESYNSSLPYLQLVSQLLQRKQNVGKYLATLNGDFLEYLQVTISSAFNEEMKNVVASIVVHTVEELGWIPSLLPLAMDIPGQLLHSMHLTQHHELKINALRLLRLMISNATLLKTLFEVNCDGITFPLVIKRYLLCAQERQARFLCIQVISDILRSDNTCSLRNGYAERLLESDIASFLFETIGTSDERLLESALECCLLLTDVPAFFQGCHSMYGIQAVIHSVDNSLAFSNVQSTILGLKLVKIILDKHILSSPLFCNALSVAQLLNVLGKGIRLLDSEVSFQSAETAAAMFKKRHLFCPIPFQTILGHVQVCSEWMQQLLHVNLVQSEPFTKNVRSHNFKSVCVTMELISVAFRLCIDCCDDPTCMVEIYELPPDENEDDAMRHTEFEELLHFLKSSLENIFVPLILSCPAFLSSASVFEHFFDCLSYWFKLQGSSEEAHAFAQLLVSSDFLRLTFNSHAILKDLTHERAERVLHSRNAFLECIMKQLITSDLMANDAYEAVTHFRNSSQTCKEMSSLQEIIHSGLATDTDFHAITCLDAQQPESVQTTFLAVCYYSSLFGQNLFSAGLMLPALNNHLLSKQAASNGFNEKFILFLIAICSYELLETNEDSDITATCIATSREATEMLVRSICSMKDPSSAYTHHRMLLKWIFSLDEVVDSIGTWMFRRCLICSIASCKDGVISGKDIIEKEQDDMDVILTVLNGTRRFSNMLMDKIFDENDATLSTHIFKILERIVDHDCSDTFKSAFFSGVPKCISYLMTPSYQHEFNSFKTVDLLLRLLNRLLHFSEENRHMLTFENGFNILQQVEKAIQWFHENKKSNLMSHALQSLNLFLAHFVHLEDSRGATILLMSTKVMSTVGDIVAVADCEKEILTEAFLTLSLLSNHQRKYRLGIAEVVSIPFSSLRRALFSSEKHMVLGCLQIISSQMACEEDTPKCILLNGISENGSHSLDFDDLMVIYSTLLNVLLKERSNSNIKDTILSCLLDVLSFTERTYGHLAYQMAGDLWTGMAIGKLMDAYMDGNDFKFISRVLRYATHISEWSIEIWLRTFDHFLDIFEDDQQNGSPQYDDMSFRDIQLEVIHEMEEIVSKWPSCEATAEWISRAAAAAANRHEASTADASQDIF